MTSRFLGGFAALAVVALAALGWTQLDFRSQAPPPTAERFISRLVRVFGGFPPVPGRLSGKPLMASERQPAPWVLGFAGGDELMLAAHLDRLVHQDLTAENLHARGLFRVFEGRYDDAIEDLAAARLLAPDDVDLASDLSTAYLARFHDAGAPLDLLLAAETAYETFHRDPSSLSASYNLALALEALYLTEGAAAAFEHYLGLDPSSEWADEARRRIATIREPTLAEQWTDALNRLGATAEPPEQTFDLHDSPHLAFQLLTHAMEDLLPEWATATQEGRAREAQARLGRLAELGRSLVANSGDETIALTVTAIETSTDVASGLHATIEGLITWRQGIEHLHSKDCAAASDFFARAETELRALRIPLSEWANYHHSVCAFYEGIPGAGERFRSLRRRLLSGDQGLPMLLGRTEWMLGLSTTGSGDWAAALPLYRSAAERFEAARDASGTAGIYTLLTESHKQLGETRRAWETRLAALAAAAELGISKDRVRALNETTLALLAEDRLSLAALVQAELQFVAGRWRGADHGVATAFVTSAQLLRRTARFDAAKKALEQAASSAENLPFGPLRTRLTANIQAERSLLVAELDPLAGVSQVTETLGRFSEIGYETQTPDLLHARARARLAIGDEAGAADDLERALVLIEERRETPADEALRISFFETFQKTYDAMIRFQARQPDGAERAFVFADLTRSRALLDRIVQGSGSRTGEAREAAPFADVRLVGRLRTLLPPHVALVQYAVLPDELLIWVVRPDHFKLVRHPIPAHELRREVDLAVTMLARDLPLNETRTASSSLYASLMAPVRDAVGPASELVIVPDRFLAHAPFAALIDPKSGRPLVETYALSFVPSARLLVSAEGSPTLRGASLPSLLAVAGNGFERARFPDLDALRGVESEVQTVAALYRQADVLTGPAATPTALAALLKHHTILHFAGHAVTPQRGLEDGGFALAAERAVPRTSVLRVADLADQGLEELELVFLSACSTLELASGGGREGIAGIVRHLLASGVPAVVGSFRPVGDRAATELAVAFHRALVRGVDPAAALRSAQLDLLNREDAALRSPASWATFQLYRRSLPSTHQEDPQ